MNPPVQRPLAPRKVMLSPQIPAYYGLIRNSWHLLPAYLLRLGRSLPHGLVVADPERLPNLLRMSLSPCRRPYPDKPDGTSTGPVGLG